MQLEAFVKEFPIYKYQLYFASAGCTAELERNVRAASAPETADGDLFILTSRIDRGLLQIFVPYECLFGTRRYSGELW